MKPGMLEGAYPTNDTDKCIYLHVELSVSHPGPWAGVPTGVHMGKYEWARTMRARIALVMSISGILPIIICHILVAKDSANITDTLFYLPLIPVIIFINWLLAGMILQPLRQLLQSSTKLANMDIRQRLDTAPNEPTETVEIRKSF